MILGLVSMQIGVGIPAAIGLGVVGFVAGVALQFGCAIQGISKAIGRYQPLFPGAGR